MKVVDINYDDKKTIGLLTFHSSYLNYGALLQAFSLQKNIDNLGYKSIIVDYRPNFIPEYSLEKQDKNNFKSRIKSLIKNAISNNYEKGVRVRAEKNADFRNKYLNVGDCTHSFNNEEAINTIVVGSDQVWNSKLTQNDSTYFLENIKCNNKISYAASVGSGIYGLPNYLDAIKDFSYLSVREYSVQEELKRHKVDSIKVCDPVFLTSKNDWERLIVEKRIRKKYVLVHIVAKENKTIEFAKKIARKNRAKLIILNKKIPFSASTINDCGPQEFLGLIRNALCVVTTSYHAVAFSLIFNTPFFFEMSDNSDRFLSLIHDFDILKNNIDNCSNYSFSTIDWSIVNEKIELQRKNSLLFLKSALLNDKSTYNSIIDYQKENELKKYESKQNKKKRIDDLMFSEKDCCGCSACYSVCPTNAISMVTNKKGFLEPRIDNVKCINCGMCIESCDFKQFVPTRLTPDSYAVRNKNMDEVKTSRSGAFFISLANYVLNKHGAVFGCEISDDKRIIHKVETTLDGIKKFKGSKYVQSDIGTTFQECYLLLKRKVPVLFSGTPCQIHGLLSFLQIRNANIANLITCDIVCHGVPSPGVWSDFIREYEKKYGLIENINFRDKNKFGWKSHVETIQLKNGTQISSSFWSNVFIERIMFRESCYNCKYTTPFRNSDFSIADYWSISKNSQRFDDELGVNHVMVRTKKAKDIFKELTDIEYEETNLFTSLQEQLKAPTKKGEDYDYFWNSYTKDRNACINKFFFKKRRKKKNNLFSKFKNLVKN